MVFYHHSNREVPNTVSSISFIHPTLLLKSAISPIYCVLFLHIDMVYLILHVCIAIGSVSLINFFAFYLELKILNAFVYCVIFAQLAGVCLFHHVSEYLWLNKSVVGSKVHLLYLRTVLNLKGGSKIDDV